LVQIKETHEYPKLEDIPHQDVLNFLPFDVVKKYVNDKKKKPDNDEIITEAYKYENYDATFCETEQAESAGRFHGFVKGAKWMRDREE